MYCQMCGKNNEDKAKFCCGCGAPVAGTAAPVVPPTAPPVAVKGTFAAVGAGKYIGVIIAVLVVLIAGLSALIAFFVIGGNSKMVTDEPEVYTELVVNEGEEGVSAAPSGNKDSYEEAPLSVSAEDEVFIRTVLSAIGTDTDFSSVRDMSYKELAFAVLDMPDIAYNCYGTKDYIPYRYSDNYEIIISAKDFDEACNAIFGRTVSKSDMRFIEEYAGYKVLSDGYQRLANNGRGGYSEVKITQLEISGDSVIVSYERYAYKTAEASLNRTPTETVTAEAVFEKSGSDKYPFRISSLRSLRTERPVESTPAEPTVESVRQLYLDACSAYSKWYLFPEVDESDSFTVSYLTYRRVTGSIDTKDEIFAELRKYISLESCEVLFDDAYIEKNGVLYHAVPVFGYEGYYTVTSESLSKNGNTWEYKLGRMYHELGDSYPEDPISFKLEYEDANLVFSQFYIHDCQYASALGG